MRCSGHLILLLACACTASPRFKGPMPVRNQHPAQLTVLHMDPAAVTPLPPAKARIHIDTAYSSYFLGGSGNGNSFAMDGELLRSGLKARVGLGHNLELRGELAVAYTTGGFLDSFLINWHDFWGSPDQGRPAAPRNEFMVRAQQGGISVFEMEEHDLDLLDLPMELSWTPLPITDERPFGAAIRAAVEWPTGDEDRGFGNGEVDVSVGVVGAMQHDFVSVTAHVQHTFAGTPDMAKLGGLEFGDVTAVGIEAEIALSDDVSVLAQTEFETSTLRKLDFSRVRDPQWLLWLGLRSQLAPHISLEIGFAEDLASFISPDFSLYLGMAFDLGGPRSNP